MVASKWCFTDADEMCLSQRQQGPCYVMALTPEPENLGTPPPCDRIDSSAWVMSLATVFGPTHVYVGVNSFSRAFLNENLVTRKMQSSWIV